MNMRGVSVFIALLALAVFALGSLITGAPYIEMSLPGGLPLGNALAALGLCAVAAMARQLARRSVLRHMANAALALAAAWLPVSIALAGNLALVFSGGRGDAWIAWSAVALIAAFASLAFAAMQLIIAALHRRFSRTANPMR